MELKSTTPRLTLNRILIGMMFVGYAGQVQSVQFNFGELEGSFDSTFSIGAQWRTQGRDKEIISQANRGTNGLSTVGNSASGVPGTLGDGSSNIDDGNLNYDTGIISSTFKGIHELSLNWGQFDLFVRGRYFYDFENKDNDRDRVVTSAATTDADVASLNAALGALSISPKHVSGNLTANDHYELSDEAQDAVGARAEFLDVFLSAAWLVNEKPLDIRLGRQVISWGESTFIQNGVNVINPVDVPALRLPGAEVRDALLPVSSIWVSYGLTDALTMEAFYQFEWEKTRVDEPGTYFATNDFVGEGGEFITISGLDECTDNAIACTFPNTVARQADREASDDGQFGFAFRWYAESLNDTEFGLYYINYHSRRPIISAVAGEYSGLFSTFQTNAQNGLVAALTAQGLSPEAAAASALVPANFFAANATLEDGTGEYFIEFPEDIQLVGLSFNTSLLNSGVSLSGEISYRQDAPIQIDDQELLQAALCTIPSTFGGLQCARSQYVGHIDPTLIPGGGGEVQGYIETEVSQAQVTAIQVFGPTWGANQLAVVGEIGVTHVSLPETSVLAVQAPGSSDDGFDADGDLGRGETGFGEEVSWGYRVRARFDYNNLFAGWNMSTTYSFAHDVNGTTPSPINNFVEDRKAFSLNLGFVYQQQLGVNLGYTTFFGAGEKNLINDRDFAALTFSYSI